MSEEEKAKARIEKSKNDGKIGMYFFIVFLLTVPFSKCFGTLFSQNSDTVAADGFYIDSYTVTLDVKENNEVYVTEKIGINFTKEYKHGIYKFTPYWYEYTGKDNKTIKRRSDIKDLKAVGDKYELSTVKGKERIKIGDPDKYVGFGLKEYVIKYRYDMGKDPFKGFDEFIFHAFGDYWGTSINNGKIIVNMPSKINRSDVNFFTDKYRVEEANSDVNYYVDGNTLIGTINKPLRSALTVDIELPDGYFKKAHNVYTSYALIPLGIVFLMTFFTFMIWLKHGKDYEKRLETVEFYPPEGLDPAIIGFIYNKNQTSEKIIPALLVSLASKGFIKINEKENKRIEVVNQIVLNNYKQDEYDNVMKKLSDNEKILFDKLFGNGRNTLILSDHTSLWEVGPKIYADYVTGYKKIVYDDNMIYGFKGMISAMLSVILTTLAFSIIKDLSPKLFFLYYIGFACFVINMVFVFIMGRRTIKGEELIAKVKGFRNFLDTVEKEKLEALVEENPYYFYNILPYTYVLNLSKKWIEKFEGISMPESYMGTYNISDESSFYDLNSNIRSAPSSSSSSGGCGGGCSSCGGGCSSCGGGGSW